MRRFIYLHRTLEVDMKDESRREALADAMESLREMEEKIAKYSKKREFIEVSVRGRWSSSARGATSLREQQQVAAISN